MIEKHSLVVSIFKFMTDCGLVILEGDIEESFLPGILIDHGTLRIDYGKLLYPGDILHEAGHLAVMSPESRNRAHVNAGSDGGEEMAAIAWSYAAAIRIGMPLDVLFHDHGYKGGGRWLRDHFSQCNSGSIGVPLLVHFDMTDPPYHQTSAPKTGFPYMKKWLRPDGN